MILGQTQQFASPEEALAHFGVKGMRWGVRKSEETSDRSAAKDAVARNELAKEGLLTELHTKKIEPASSQKTSKVNSKAENQKSAEHHGLTPTQKKVLIGLGVTAGVAGFIAYKKYSGQPLIPDGIVGFSPKELARRGVSKQDIGDLTGGHKSLKLWAPEKLMVDVSKGYADMRPIAGFANEEVAKRHAEMVESLDRFRKMYPSVRNLNIEVVPMSHDPEVGTQLLMQKGFAAVMGVRAGEARIYYNDITGKLDPLTQATADRLFPGMDKKGSLGAHEMGHLLAVAGGRQIPAFPIINKMAEAQEDGSPMAIAAAMRAGMKYTKNQNRLHNELFKKHGTSFKELSKLSNYAATQPIEGLAELSRYYHGPEQNKLSPELRAKAKAIFDELGGVNVDRSVGSRVLEKVA